MKRDPRRGSNLRQLKLFLNSQFGKHNHEWSEDFAKTHSPKRAKLLRLLWDCKWHHHKELRVAGVRYSARLLELKRLGYLIGTDSLENEPGNRYRLLSRVPTTPQQRQIKVFLEPADVRFLLNHHREILPRDAYKRLNDAFNRYTENLNKL